MKKTLLSILVFLILLSSYAQQENEHDILVFTKTAGYRHKAIEAGVGLFKKLGKEHQFNIIHSEDADIFNEKNLKSIDLVVFFEYYWKYS